MSIIFSKALLLFSSMSSYKDMKDARELDGELVVFEYTIYAPEDGELNWRCDGIHVGSVLSINIPRTNQTFQAPSKQLLISQIDDEIERIFSLCQSDYYASSRRRFSRRLSDETYEQEERKAIQEFM